MRSKKEFFGQVKSHVNQGRALIQDYMNQLAELNEMINSDSYSANYKRTEVQPKINRLHKLIDEEQTRVMKSVNEECAAYINELRNADALDPDQITDDLKLLQTGIKLRRRDIDALLRRNADNGTMQLLILRYCHDNDIETGIHFRGHEPIVNEVSSIPYTVEVVMRWAGKNESVYERLMGEGSPMEQAFSNEE